MGEGLQNFINLLLTFLPCCLSLNEGSTTIEPLLLIVVLDFEHLDIYKLRKRDLWIGYFTYLTNVVEHTLVLCDNPHNTLESRAPVHNGSWIDENSRRLGWLRSRVHVTLRCAMPLLGDRRITLWWSRRELGWRVRDLLEVWVALYMLD